MLWARELPTGAADCLGPFFHHADDRDFTLALVADGLNSLPQDTDALEIVKEDFALAEVR